MHSFAIDRVLLLENELLKFHNTGLLSNEDDVLSLDIEMDLSSMFYFPELHVCEDFGGDNEMHFCTDINLAQLDVFEEELDDSQLDLYKVDEVWTTPNPFQVLLEEDENYGEFRYSTPEFRKSPTLLESVDRKSQ